MGGKLPLEELMSDNQQQESQEKDETQQINRDKEPKLNRVAAPRVFKNSIPFRPRPRRPEKTEAEVHN
jgi:hypothetical protein